MLRDVLDVGKRESSPPNPPGRQRDEGLTSRILEETLRALAESGYAQLKIEQIAEAAGCSKGTIYRRWNSRAELAVAAIASHVEIGERSHSGDVVEDLFVHVMQHVTNQTASTRDGWPPVTAMLAVAADREIRNLYWERITATRRRMGREILRDGIDAGQLPDDVDADAMLDILAGYVFYRGVFREVPLDREDIRELVRATVNDPPRRSRATDEEGSG